MTDERDRRALQIVEECLAFDDVGARAAAVTERGSTCSPTGSSRRIRATGRMSGSS